MYCGQLHPRLFTKGHVRTQNWNDSTTRLKAHNRMTTSQNDIHTLKVTYQQSALSHTEGLHTHSSSWSQLCHWLLRQYPSQTPMGTHTHTPICISEYVLVGRHSQIKCCCFEGHFSRTSIGLHPKRHKNTVTESEILFASQLNSFCGGPVLLWQHSSFMSEHHETLFCCVLTYIASLDGISQHAHNIMAFTVGGLEAFGPTHQFALQNICRLKKYSPLLSSG